MWFNPEVSLETSTSLKLALNLPLALTEALVQPQTGAGGATMTYHNDQVHYVSCVFASLCAFPASALSLIKSFHALFPNLI